jgi:hypothetical protein
MTWNGDEWSVFPQFLGETEGSESAPSFGHTAPLRQRPRALAGNGATMGNGGQRHNGTSRGEHGRASQSATAENSMLMGKLRGTWGGNPMEIPWKILLESQSTLWLCQNSYW